MLPLLFLTTRTVFECPFLSTPSSEYSLTILDISILWVVILVGIYSRIFQNSDHPAAFSYSSFVPFGTNRVALKICAFGKTTYILRYFSFDSYRS